MALEKIVKNSSGVPTGEYERIAGGTLWADAPIGTIFPIMSSVVPAGFLLCDGTAYSAATYPELWAILPSTVKDTTNNTFTIDLREVALKGAGLTGHTVGNHLDADGLAVGEFLDDRVQTHEHYIGDSATPQHLGYSDRDGQNAGIGNRTVDATFESDRKWIALGQTNVGIARSGRYGDTTEVKSVGVNYIIKAKMVALPADLASGVEEYINDNATSEISSSNKLVTESDLDAGPTYFTEKFAGAANAGTVTKTWTCTKAGTYFILVCGNPYSSISNMEVVVKKGTTVIRNQSNNNADGSNYANLSVFVPVSLAVNDVVSAECIGFASMDVYNSWAIWRVGN